MTRILLAPILGAAFATVVVAAASIAGFAISSSAWLAICLCAAAMLRVAARGFVGIREIWAVYAILLVANVVTVGLGVLLFGTAWQGYTNGDAAVNSLAAEYFGAYPFFATPSLAAFFAGTDYSSSAVLLNVAGGQRFGDVMLLSLSARVFGQLPDQIYMAHALALRCAMLAAAALLVHSRGKSLWPTSITLFALTLSPLVSYAYVNQLIGQIGGMGIAFGLVAMLDQFMRTQERDLQRQCFLPTALLGAALCETYPESLPYVGLCATFLLLYYRWSTGAPPWTALARFVVGVSIIVLILVNAYAPSIVYSVTNILAWGGIVQGRALESNFDFSYAFVPDFAAYMVGFEFLREALHEPAATLAIGAGAVALLAIIVFLVRRRRDYPLLFVSALAGTLVFLLFFLRGNGFGSFKMMILMQPIVFGAAGEMFARALTLRSVKALVTLTAAFVAAARGDAAYIGRSLVPLAEISHLAQADVLGELQQIRARTHLPTILDPSNYLLRKFGLLRPGPVPLLAAESFSARSGTQNFLQAVKQNPFSRWLPQMGAMFDAIFAYYDRTYEKKTFTCPGPNDAVSFEHLAATATRGRWDTVFSGPRSVPFNARSYAGHEELLSLSERPNKQFLTFRASTLGSFYGHKSDGYAGAVALYTSEPDFALPGSIIAATGRYSLFQVLAPSSDPVRVSVSYSRSPLGGERASLAPITIYGEQAVEIAMAGGGAFNETSPPVRPCVVDGKAYVIVDFGADPAFLVKQAPLLYRALGVRYLPDVRRVSGYLRDLSILPVQATTEAAEPPSLAQRWSFHEFDASFDYSGFFEDGWMSDKLTLHPRTGTSRRELTIDFEVPAQFVDAHPVTLTLQVDGQVIGRQVLVPGANRVSADLPHGSDSVAMLSVDTPTALPAPDGRIVLGLVKGISTR